MVDGRVSPQVFIKMGLYTPKCKRKQLKQWFPYIIATIASKQFSYCCDHVEILRSTMRIALSRRSLRLIADIKCKRSRRSFKFFCSSDHMNTSLEEPNSFLGNKKLAGKAFLFSLWSLLPEYQQPKKCCQPWSAHSSSSFTAFWLIFLPCTNYLQ